MQVPPEAFLLLSLPNCTLSSKTYSDSGILGLECVTISSSDASGSSERDVYLVLRLNTSEIPVDPTRVIQRSDTPNARTYTFYSSPNDPNELVLTVPTPLGDVKSTTLHEDLETFEGILEQYATDFRSPSSFPAAPQPQVQGRAIPNGPPPTYINDEKDLRGHLVMINEDTGEVIGEVEDRFRVREDPTMYQRGHENDPVIFEVPDEVGLREGDAGAMEAFARLVPPDQQDWITKSAAVARYIIFVCLISILRANYSFNLVLQYHLQRIYWLRRLRVHRIIISQSLPRRRTTPRARAVTEMRRGLPQLPEHKVLPPRHHPSHPVRSSFSLPSRRAKVFEVFTPFLGKPSK